jgi:hypothetical protein
VTLAWLLDTCGSALYLLGGWLQRHAQPRTTPAAPEPAPAEDARPDARVIPLRKRS